MSAITVSITITYHEPGLQEAQVDMALEQTVESYRGPNYLQENLNQALDTVVTNFKKSHRL